MLMALRSPGLVSAAKMVADSVQDMLTSANDIVSGGNKVDLAKVCICE